MQKSHLALLAAVALLSVGMFGLNLRLAKRNRELKTQVDAQILGEKSTNAPLPGWIMPPLKVNTIDGDPHGAIDLQHSAAKMTLLLFDPGDPISDQNWKFWGQLLADPDLTYQFLPVTAAHTVSRDYLKRFQLGHHAVEAGLDPDIAKQMRMQATPQTIYLEGGTVKKVWFGLLSDVEVKEIKSIMQEDD